ncbi:hypothetical protein ACSSWA_01315 [Melioribacter sp. Ez-97]|uniref:hypothetical protein n=1 Tax=Melioribacter sp. Ez-97 TaxID=3423434 RepID=UPI003ED91107
MKNEIGQKAERKLYVINGKKVYLWDDFNLEEKEWIDKVLDKLSGNQNKVEGGFTNEEMIKTLSIILKNEDGTDVDRSLIIKIRESQQVKILADFFLTKSVLGAIINESLKN